MDQPTVPYGRDMRRMLSAAAAVLVVVCLGMAAVLWFVGASIDTHQRAQEERLAQRRLESVLSQLTDDITSSTVWSDSAWAFDGGRVDLEWTQLNFGDYYADYMDHAVTLIYDPDGTLVQASRASEPTPLEAEAALAAAVAPLVNQVRGEAATRHRDLIGFPAVATGSGVVRVGSELYLVGASTVVRDIPGGPHLARDPLVVSAQPFSVLIASMGKDLGLQGAAFRETGDGAAAALALTDVGGKPLGVVGWTPDQPGRDILMSAGPILAVLLVALTAAGGYLWMRIAANVRRLSESETALAAALTRAESASLAKSRFLSNMSHELRTPLNGVIGMAEIMSMDELSESQRQRLGILRESGQALLNMIDHILDVVRLDRDQISLVDKPFRPQALLTGLAEEFRAGAEAKGLRLEVRGQAPGEWLGDETHIAKVLRYLLENAVAFTRAGVIRLGARVGEGGLLFEVQDSGAGMTQETVGTLFAPFSQADESTTRSVGGAGLGLTICRRLVVAMNGRIEVDSVPGAGSNFRVFLPLKPRVGERPLISEPAIEASVAA